MNSRLNFKVDVFEVLDANGRVQYRGPKDGAEFTLTMKECQSSTMRKVARPSAKLQKAAYFTSNASFNNR